MVIGQITHVYAGFMSSSNEMDDVTGEIGRSGANWSAPKDWQAKSFSEGKQRNRQAFDLLMSW